MGDYGPVHQCRVCGRDVQVYRGPRTGQPVVVTFGEYGDMEIHRHEIADLDLGLDRYLECICGIHVIERPGIGRFNRDGLPHRCYPARGEAVALVDSQEMPRGVLGWQPQSSAERATP